MECYIFYSNISNNVEFWVKNYEKATLSVCLPVSPSIDHFNNTSFLSYPHKSDLNKFYLFCLFYIILYRDPYLQCTRYFTTKLYQY